MTGNASGWYEAGTVRANRARKRRMRLPGCARSRATIEVSADSPLARRVMREHRGDTEMSHADDTTQLWGHLAWIESVCDRWEGFFYALIDEPDRAEALCLLGIQAVSGKSCFAPQSVNSRWMALFGCLAGRAHTAVELCEIGLRMVRNGPPRDGERLRNEIRTLLNGRPLAASVV